MKPLKARKIYGYGKSRELVLFCPQSRAERDKRRQTFTCLKQTLLFKFQEYPDNPNHGIVMLGNIFFFFQIWILIPCVVWLLVSPKQNKIKNEKPFFRYQKVPSIFANDAMGNEFGKSYSAHLFSYRLFWFCINFTGSSVSIRNWCAHKPVSITSHLWQNWGSVANKTTRCACLLVVYGTKACHVTLLCLFQF